MARGSVAWSEVLTEAMRALGRNRVRSMLTMLGVIIGVASVISTLAIGQGAKASVQAQIRSLGSNVLMVFAGSSMAGGVRGGSGTSQALTLDDARAIQSECDAAGVASPTVRTFAQVVAGDQNWSTIVVGGDENYAVVRDWPVADGRSFTVSDVRGAAKVCLLGATVARELFGDENPVGSTIRIRKVPFHVIGVLAPKGSSSFGQDQDDVIVAPISAVQKKLMGVTWVGAILVSAGSEAQVPGAIEEITSLMRQRHRIAPGQPDDFAVRSQAEIASTAESTSQVMTLLLSSIALVSLLVGGIGIMNIMLVSVTERTREIGVRRALGARGGDILLQFLAEAAFVSLAGGAIGVALGVGTAQLVSSTAHWPTLVGPGSILLAFGFSALVGLAFGYYPALSAARLNPIDSLRYE